MVDNGIVMVLSALHGEAGFSPVSELRDVRRKGEQVRASVTVNVNKLRPTGPAVCSQPSDSISVWMLIPAEG